MDFFRALILGLLIALPLGPLMFTAVAHMQRGDHRSSYVLVLAGVTANAFWIAIGVGLLAGVAETRDIYTFAATHQRISILCGGVLFGIFGFCYVWNREALVRAKMLRSFWAALFLSLQNPDRMFLIVLLAAPFGIHLNSPSAATNALSGMILGDTTGWFITLYLGVRFASTALFGRLAVYMGSAFMLLGAAMLIYGLVS